MKPTPFRETTVSRAAAATALACALATQPLVSFGNEPPPPIAEALQGGRLSGEGTLRWLGLKVYDARLWVTRRGLDAGRFAAQPFALELRYARSLAGAKIAEASHKEIERMGFGSEPQRTAWLAAMRSLFPDVRADDRITGVWRPGRGTEFLLNDRVLGRIDGAEFAHAFFSIWLDPRTVSPELREALLAGAGPERSDGTPR